MSETIINCKIYKNDTVVGGTTALKSTVQSGDQHGSSSLSIPTKFRIAPPFRMTGAELRRSAQTAKREADGRRYVFQFKGGARPDATMRDALQDLRGGSDSAQDEQ